MSRIKHWWWVYRCANLIQKICGWTRTDARDYAETLYETYVLEDSDGWSPADALAEDMSYWGD